MAELSGGLRAALMTLVVVVAFGAGAATVIVAMRPAAPVASPSEAPATTPDAELRGDLNQLRASCDKLAKAQADLQARLAELTRELEKTRADIRASKSSKAVPTAAKPPVRPSQKIDPTGVRSVIQAVDNKNDLYVISAGSKDTVREGMEFEVSRQGKPVGTIVINKVFPNYASGSRKPGSAAFDVQPGDDCSTVPAPK